MVDKKPMAPMCVTMLTSVHDAFYVRGGSEGVVARGYGEGGSYKKKK